MPYYNNNPTYGAYPYVGFSQYQPQQTQRGGFEWVQGENAAKSFPVAANTSVLLMDSEGSRFYIKSADAVGMPLPLRTFEFREVSAQNAPQSTIPKTDTAEYVTREEFERRLKNLAPAAKETEERV